MKTERGFTLIELVVVISIIGILAAVAIPRFILLTTEARIATLSGTAGSLRSAVELVQSKYYAVGNNTATTVNMNGVTITVSAGLGLPTGDYPGIGTALGFPSAQNANGLIVDYSNPTAVTFEPSSGGGATCQDTYNATTGQVTVIITGC